MTSVEQISIDAEPTHEIQQTDSLQADVRRSVANAMKLGLSLLATWVVALGVRLMLPRFLGPSLYGAFQFADAFTTTILVVTCLGVETYIRKEITTNGSAASKFLGGTTLLGALLGIIVLFIALPSLHWAGKSDLVVRLVLILGLAQMFTNASTTFSALLHAVGDVGGLSILNVAVKLTWGIGIFAVLSLGYGAQSAALVILASETLRAIWLAAMARRYAGATFDVDMRASWRVVVASLPYYVAALAQTAYGRIDISVLSFITTDTEVGWYAAAAAIGGISMLMSPLIGWVLIPLTSRAAKRSEDELMMVGRRATEVIFTLAMPVTLGMGLAATEIVELAFGSAYAPAARSLHVLAPTFVLTYATIVGASMLVRLERGWWVTGVSVVGMFIAPTLNLLLVPRFLAAYGPGGAGLGAAVSLVLVETFAATALFYPMGRRAFDQRLLAVIGKTVAVALTIVAIDRMLAPIGAWRLLIDGLLYVVLVLVTGAVDMKVAAGYVRQALASRRSASSAA